MSPPIDNDPFAPIIFKKKIRNFPSFNIPLENPDEKKNFTAAFHDPTRKAVEEEFPDGTF